MISSSRMFRCFAMLVLAAGLVTGAGIVRSVDRVNEICVIAGDINWCAPDGRQPNAQ